LLTAVTFFQNAPFFTNKILFFKNLILKIKYIKIKKRKKRGVAEPPPWGWLATPWAMGVVRPPPDRTTPMAQGVPATPLFFLFFFFFFFS
jgi:hypothetical protein